MVVVDIPMPSDCHFCPMVKFDEMNRCNFCGALDLEGLYTEVDWYAHKETGRHPKCPLKEVRV